VPYRDPAKKRENNRRYGTSIKGRYRHGQKKAKKRGIAWDLSFAEYEWLMERNNCYYCSGPLTLYGSNLDRLNNNKGYNTENAVACCGFCNQIKGATISKDEMRAIAQLIRFMREGVAA
jgi:hypothetical protein